MFKNCFKILFVFLIITSLVFPQVSTVSFTKPGYMMKIPTSSIYTTPYTFRTGFSSDIYGFKDSTLAKGVFLESDIGNSFKMGFTSIQGTGSDAPVEFGFHFQKRLFVYGDISFSAGLHDLIIKQGSKKVDLSAKSLSIFGVISNEKQFPNSSLSTYMGFGTGGLAADSTIGVFTGMLFHTNLREKYGGIDLLAEFDGGGVNVGTRIPLTNDYNIAFGVNNILKLYKFGNDEFESDNLHDFPSLNISLDFRIPRIRPEDSKRRVLEGMVDEKSQMILDLEEEFASRLDSTLKAADLEIAKLRDSLDIYGSQIKYLSSQVAYLRQMNSVLEDSIRSVKLAKHAMEHNINLALKHLSRSLRYFYTGDFREALKEVDAAIQLNNNLALAYARRGSIYYKLGDIDRATINWNLALRIDPDYDDVRNILRAMSENRLRSAGNQDRVE